MEIIIALVIVLVILFVGYSIILIRRNNKITTENEVLLASKIDLEFANLNKQQVISQLEAKQSDMFDITNEQEKEIIELEREEHNMQTNRNYYRKDRNETRKELEESIIILTKISVETKNKEHIEAIDKFIFKK